MFQVPAIISKITTMADKSLRLQVDTQELGSEDKMQVFELHEKFGHFIMKEGEIKEDELLNLPDVKMEFKGDKTPSQRFRNVLYRVHERSTSTLEFDSFYKVELEKLINHYKDKYLGD